MWNIVVADQASKLSHLVLILLAKFEVYLQTKKLKMPQPRGKRITANPTTDAEMITDLRLSQWKSAQVKKKAERRKIAEPNTQSRDDNLNTKSWYQQNVGEVKSTEELSHAKFGDAKTPFRNAQLRHELYNQADSRTGRSLLRNNIMMPNNEAWSARSYGDHNQDYEMRKMRIERPAERNFSGTERIRPDFTRESRHNNQGSFNQSSLL